MKYLQPVARSSQRLTVICPGGLPSHSAEWGCLQRMKQATGQCHHHDIWVLLAIGLQMHMISRRMGCLHIGPSQECRIGSTMK